MVINALTEKRKNSCIVRKNSFIERLALVRNVPITGLAIVMLSRNYPAFHFHDPFIRYRYLSEKIFFLVLESVVIRTAGKKHEILVGNFPVVVHLVGVVGGVDDFNAVEAEVNQLPENFIRNVLAGMGKKR